MTHKKQFVAMLEDAGIDFGYSGGDSIIVRGCRFRFYGSDSLKEIEPEGGYSDDEDY